MLAAVITCSDRAVSGAYSDRSGPLLRQALDALGFETRDPRIVPDNLVMIRAAIREAVASGARVVLTTGGTGVGPRDVTVEATLDLLACELPGIMEAIRRHGAEKTPRALLSRGPGGVVECAGTRAIIINAPGRGRRLRHHRGRRPAAATPRRTARRRRSLISRRVGTIPPPRSLTLAEIVAAPSALLALGEEHRVGQGNEIHPAQGTDRATVHAGVPDVTGGERGEPRDHGQNPVTGVPGMRHEAV